ncbi:MAG: hypothetical protein J6A74_05105 [Oscillospiraceae bacterium]|nr:hypothetical protein [Oscillospiraceae bacterium]
MDFITGLRCSLIALAIIGAISLYGYLFRKEQDWILSPLQVLTVGVFAALFLFFLPVCQAGGTLTQIPFGYILEALHRTLRIFVVDIDFTDVAAILQKQPESLQAAYQVLGGVLYALAPVLLFSNLLLLFRDLWAELRFFYISFRPIYLFSQLNDKSIALAEDIFRNPPKARFPWLRRWVCPPAIVFTQVCSQQDQSLLVRAKAIRAICLKKDVSRLNFYDKWSRVEIFLIGEKEDENVTQSITIMDKLSDLHKKNVQLYVFSRKESDGCILDSVDYGNLEQALKRRKMRMLQNRSCFTLHDGKSFSLRRVDVVQHLIWTSVPQMDLFARAKRNGGNLSVLILGFGSYGQEFFKTLLWFCQFEGIHLKLTVIDKADSPDALSLIGHHCPELMLHNRSAAEGDAQYDIEVLSGVDMQGDTFQQMLCYHGVNAPKAKLAQRLRETDLAFVSMGDDDLNVETALYLRTLMDQVENRPYRKEMTAEDETVQIYAVVFDEVKSKLLRAEEKNRRKASEDGFFLKNHKNQKLHICFLGGLKEQFCYQRINWQLLEQEAYYIHRGWEDIEEQTSQETSPDHNDPAQECLEQLNYHKFEYYRNSSIAKALYQKAVARNFDEKVRCLEKGPWQTCQCKNCIRRKKSEHMRWNAYMRVCGWRYGQRNDRAKLHDNLVPWERLEENDKRKD